MLKSVLPLAPVSDLVGGNDGRRAGAEDAFTAALSRRGGIGRAGVVVGAVDGDVAIEPSVTEACGTCGGAERAKVMVLPLTTERIASSEATASCGA
jgi:hypothetical protein